ncbi:hypothetical protein E3N88_36766 [Mikania micrantha]|uniref:Uncharacterized protein n=1 Tax=Mikania micrantha TaxID=192012 RepID=A0A5N6M5N8_9ASTR|nr:hypothetical protein E3N88_36766 [Mikania micrantha]
MLSQLLTHILCTSDCFVGREKVFENLEELDKEKDKYYALKARDIDEFRVKAEIFSIECERRVEELRCCVNELNSCFIQLQHSIGYSENPYLAAAEMRNMNF